MTEPTDAEILALNAGETHFSESPTKYPEAGHGTQYHAGAPGVLSFARAILAKWGTPPVVAGEPVAWRHRMGPTDIWVECSKEFHDWVVREPSAWPRDEVQALCIATPQPTQAQAWALPMTDEQLWANDEIMSLNADLGWHMDTIRMFARVIERAHGIKGGQHG